MNHHSQKGKVLALDFGEKRVGVAMSDESGSLAFPHAVFPNDESLLPTLLSLLKEQGARVLVIGESKDEKGRENSIMQHIRSFVGALSSMYSGDILFITEDMTSMHASVNAMMHSDVRRGKQVYERTNDSEAAALILQRYLDTHSQL